MGVLEYIIIISIFEQKIEYTKYIELYLFKKLYYLNNIETSYLYIFLSVYFPIQELLLYLRDYLHYEIKYYMSWNNING